MNETFVQTSPENSVFALRERIKELSCLYRIADLANRPELDTCYILNACVGFIPAALQFPDHASARLLIDNKEYHSNNFQTSNNFLQAAVSTHLSAQGMLEVFYKDEPQNRFLAEEEKLIQTIAQHISLILERRNSQEYNAKLQEQLRHADRLATIGQLSAGIAHEINEPLSAILGFAQLVVSENELAEPALQDMKKIVNATLHAREIVRKLMLFSRQVPPKMVAVDINRLIEEGFYFLENRCTKQGVKIIRELCPSLPTVIADPGQMHQVLVNLSVNAMQAMPNGGTIFISTQLCNDEVIISICDTGMGMDSDVLGRIFIPFFTTKDIDQGTGLGLSVVHGIISAHGARLTVDSEPGKGSEFKIFMKVNCGEKP
ncbi:MAG: ATP-binding protein [Candidatus Cloacimonas sp.]|jgi:signal transduction histidine kinase|nr:ATP-binding protein [Candidatus Cloacimonas sp.]